MRSFPLLAALLLLVYTRASVAGRVAEVTPLRCADGFDATALTKVDVAANRGAARLFATSVDACSEDDSDCIASYTSGDRKASRQLGRIVAKINKALQDSDGQAYGKLTNNDPGTAPFDLVEDPPEELGLSQTEQAAWKTRVAQLKAKRSTGKPIPRNKAADGGYSQQMAYVCHTTMDNRVTLYMRVAGCTDAAPCDDFDDVE